VALAGWKAQPRTTPRDACRCTNLAIETAQTLRALFRLALGQSESLIGSIMRMLRVDLPIPDHTTLNGRASGPPVQLCWRNGMGELRLIVDSTALKLRGAGEWLLEEPSYHAPSFMFMTASARIAAYRDGSSYFKSATTGSPSRSIVVNAARRSHKS
jgi:hypothetical protein